MKNTGFLVLFSFFVFSCSRQEKQSCEIDSREPLSKQESSNGFELAEVAGTWRLDSLVQRTKGKPVTIKSPFQAYYFHADGSFSFIDGKKSAPEEHVYGKLVMNGREMYVVDQASETTDQALYHWEILQLTKDHMKLRDFMVEEVANVEGDVYLTHIPDLKIQQN